MKTIRVFFVLAFLTVMLLPPGGQVQADVLNLPALDVSDPGPWHCYSASPGPCPEDGEPDGTDPWGYAGTTTNHGNNLLYGKIVCTGFGCSSIDVYVQIDFTASWTSPYYKNYVVNVEGQAWGYNTSIRHTVTIPCGSGFSGECGGRIYVKIPAVEVSAEPTLNFHISSYLGFTGLGSRDTASKAFNVLYSGTPIDIDKCDEDYATSNCNSQEIDPTSETGITGTLVEDETYRLEVKGGPWYSEGGGDPRYDIEVSFDEGDTWISAMELMTMDEILCIQNDPDNEALYVIYFEAPSDSIQVRVVDTEGDFADNTGSIEIEICDAEEITGVASSCVGQFTVGDVVVLTGTIQANVIHLVTSVDGDFYWVEPGQWYVLTTSGGPWLNGGDPPDRYDIEMADEVSGITPVAWYSPDEFPSSNCMSEGGDYVSVYFQGSASQQLFLRVADEGLNWIDNTGSVDFMITEVDEYEPYASGCSLSFDTNNLVESRYVNPRNGAGITLMETSDWEWPAFPFLGGETGVPKIVRYYVLETTGIWYDGGIASAIGEIKQDTDAWYDIGDWSGSVACVQVLDPIGHLRVMFDASKEHTWKFRVADSGSLLQDLTSFLDNTGQFGYKLYWGINYNIPMPVGPDLPETGYCDDYYSYDAAKGVTITLNGDNENGLSLPLIKPDTVVAIQVTDGPWHNNGVDSYQTAISDNNGLTYTEITSYDGTVCKQQSPDNDHPLLYIYGREGKSYRVRVYDPGGNYEDNTLSIKMTVYPGEASSIVDPWHSCANNYDLVEVLLSDTERTISAALDGGIAIPKITAESTYAVEITGESYWMKTILVQEYGAEITNGSEWQDLPLADFIDCAVQINETDTPALDARYRVYFTAEAGKIYRLRVNSPIWPNIGNLMYRLYTTSAHTSPIPPNPWTPFPENPWGGCNAICIHPGSLFSTGSFSLGSMPFGTLGTIDFPTVNLPIPNVGSWVDYARCSIVVYFAWCDWHTDALTAMFGLLTDKEPFGTLVELSDGYTAVKNGLQGLVDEGGEAGPDDLTPDSIIFGGAQGGENGFGGLIPNLQESNPLFGGQFDFTGSSETIGGGESRAAYEARCSDATVSKIGNAASGFCWVLGLIHNDIWGVNLLIAIQVIFDFAVLFGFIAYIMDKWVGKGVMP